MHNHSTVLCTNKYNSIFASKTFALKNCFKIEKRNMYNDFSNITSKKIILIKINKPWYMKVETVQNIHILKNIQFY